jgi:hypothetical protein
LSVCQTCWPPGPAGENLSYQTFALGALAGQLAGAPHGLCTLAGTLFRGLLEMRARFHLTEKAFALHLLLQRAQGLFDIVVADDDLDDGSLSFGSGAPSARRNNCSGLSCPVIGMTRIVRLYHGEIHLPTTRR